MNLLRIPVNKLLPKGEEGFLLPSLLSITIALLIISTAALLLMDSNYLLVKRNINSQKAFNIAEAGVNYYLWHLAHNQTDYKDGGTTPTTPDPTLGYGPYVHQYYDDNNVNEGTYTLWINPQGGGSTIVTVRAIGQVAGGGAIRTIQAQIGAPSFASYAVASDGALWFGNTETADGPVDSNLGIRMDGPNTDIVSNANSTYVPSVSVGGDGHTSENGVWCSTSVTAPVNCNTRNKTTWTYPVPSINFNQVTTALCNMKKTAFAANSATSSLAGLANACSQTPNTLTPAYLPQRSTSGAYSISKGYLIQLNTNGTYNLYNVNAETDTASSYSTALTLQLVSTGVAIPASGVIFAEDNVWVRSNPTFHGRVTIGAGRLATSVNAEIVIADNLLYSTKNGSDAIGLISEDSVTVAPYAIPTTASFNYEIDAAVIAQAGNVDFPVTYRVNSNQCTKGYISPNQTFTYYGSIALRQTWTWNWLVGGPCGNAVNDPVNGWISGVENTTTQYDYNLEYSPPPSFPVTSTYNVLSWREVLTHP